MAVRIHSEAYGIDRSFTEDLITLGRGPGNMIRLDHPKVSGIHGQIVRREGRYFYQDLRSTNGSLVRQGDEEVALDGVVRREVALDEEAITLLLGDLRQPVELALSLSADPPEPAPAAGDEVPARTIVASRALRDLDTLTGQLLDQRWFNRERIEGLLALLPELQRSMEPTTLADALVRFIFDTLGRARVVGLFFEVDERMVPLLLRVRGHQEPLPIPWPRIEPLFQAALERRAAIQVDDARRVSSRFEEAVSGLRAALACPLFQGERVCGLVVAAACEPFEPVELDWLTVLAYQGGLSLANAQLFKERARLQERLRDENSFLRERLQRSPAGEPVTIIGDSPALARVLHQVQVVARTDTTVLIEGETGTGKELVARMIHQQSERSERIFAAVNCGALADSLLESELFGHVRGAFTGAVKDKKGLLQVADGGTLFLDELGEISPRLQVKLLRVLENGDVTPVGSARTQRVDVRIVAATNKNLEAEVSAGNFREDLYYRVNVFPIRLPPLRDRGGDVRLLADHFLKIFNARFERALEDIEATAMIKLEQYAWPGNVRELQNEIERAVLMAEDGTLLRPEDLSERIGGMLDLPVAVGPLHDAMARLEEQYIRRALRQHDYNRTRTAKTLGISRQALTAKLHKYDLLHLKKR